MRTQQRFFCHVEIVNEQCNHSLVNTRKGQLLPRRSFPVFIVSTKWLAVEIDQRWWREANARAKGVAVHKDARTRARTHYELQSKETPQLLTLRQTIRPLRQLRASFLPLLFITRALSVGHQQRGKRNRECNPSPSYPVSLSEPKGLLVSSSVDRPIRRLFFFRWSYPSPVAQ